MEPHPSALIRLFAPDHRDSVVGILRVGSAARGYADHHSDEDFELVLEDNAYRQCSVERRISRRGGMEGLLLPLSDWQAKASSTSDIDHWPYERCDVLFDPEGLIARELPRIRTVPADVREQRCRLHLFEMLFETQRMPVLLARGDELDVRMAVSSIVRAVVDLVCLHYDRWPPPPHWTRYGLSELESSAVNWGVRCLALLRKPDLAAAELLRDDLLELLGCSGAAALHRMTCQVTGAQDRELRERWGRL